VTADDSTFRPGPGPGPDRADPADPDDRRGMPREDAERRRRRDQAFALARAAEPHDPAIGGHLRRLNALVQCLARELGLGEAEAERLGDDAMLHDVGKLHVPAALLGRAGPLDQREREIVARHTVLGEAFLRGRPGLGRAASIARHHHEAWDGSGGPDGLRGTAIPLAARLTAAADVLDALAAARVYKPAWSWEAAVDHVRGLAGGTLDPGIVMAVVAADADGRLQAAWRAADDSLAGADQGDPAAGITRGDRAA
jgi:HD-GYP domain-containing protein (c-di-GMP phosphodiesterase class II)